VIEQELQIHLLRKLALVKISPVKGTKVEVSYKTKKISPETYAMLTTGRTAREGSKTSLELI
jgi:hypothetical protein